jgi:methyl-accepting chemotaxis protein
VAEISAASHEQSDGIGQVNTAVVDMEKVTQQNAATAEESASAAEQMAAQSQTMRCLIEDMVSLIGISGATAANQLSHAGKEPEIEGSERKVPAMITHSEEITPQQVIPLEGDDVKDF